MKFLGKTKIFATIIYILSALFLIYTIFLAVSQINYLSSVASSGMYMDVGFTDMLLAFMGNVGPYIFYTIALFFFAYAIQLIAGDIVPEDQVFEEKLAESPASSYQSEAVQPAVTREPVGEETLEIEDEPQAAYDQTQAFDEPENSSVEDVVATIADVESSQPEEEIELEEPAIEIEDNDTPEAARELEEKLAEAIDEGEAQEEVEELEMTNEEDK